MDRSLVAALTAADHGSVVLLLRAAGLPWRDVGAQTMANFLGVREHGRCVAAMGLERYGAVGLLRSLVVAPTHRGQGLAGQLVAGLEARARAQEVWTLVLLTETAQGLFARRGYRDTPRAGLPAALLESPQFRGTCPASAACLSKHLGHPRTPARAFPADTNPP